MSYNKWFVIWKFQILLLNLKTANPFGNDGECKARIISAARERRDSEDSHQLILELIALTDKCYICQFRLWTYFCLTFEF